MVRQVDCLAEFNKILQEAGGRLVVVDFTAVWCPPCRMIAPAFEKLAEENKDVIFLKVDVDKASDVARHYDIRAMPTFMFFKNRAKVDVFSGANLGKLKELVKAHKS